MNADQLKKQLGHPMKLRPLAVRLDNVGRDIGSRDDDWLLTEMTTKPKAVVLSNTATGHAVTLQSDNVKEFRTPHYLILRCVLVIQGMRITIEPIVGQ